MAKAVVRWVTKDRRGLYLNKDGYDLLWVRNPARASLDERRSDWYPNPGEHRVKVYLQVQEEAQAR